MLTPRQPHRLPIHRQIHVANHWPVLDLGTSTARGTEHHDIGLLNHQLHIPATAGIVQDTNIFQTYQRPHNLARLGHDEGVSLLMLHTTSLKRLRHLTLNKTPPESEEPHVRQFYITSGPTRVLSFRT